MSIQYCQRCDLGFCEKHVESHFDGPGHLLAPWPGPTPFCCVCVGIFAPAKKEGV